jgi:hypothetical protein
MAGYEMNASMLTGHEFERCAAENRNLAAGLQPATPTQCVALSATSRICQDKSGDVAMRKASKQMPEQGTQALSSAPDLIPAETKINRGLSEPGHIMTAIMVAK